MDDPFNVKYTKMLSFSLSRGPHGPDLPSPFWRKFQLSVHTCMMMGEASLETSHDMINSNDVISAESTIPKIFKRLKHVLVPALPPPGQIR